MRTALKVCAVVLFSVALMAQSGATRKKSSGAVTAAVTSADVRELRQALAAQQQQIQQMQEEMRRRDQLLEQMQQALAQAQTNASTAQEKAAAAQSLASQQGESVSKIEGDLADVKLNQTNAAVQTQEEQKKVAKAVEAGFGKVQFHGLFQAWFATGDGGFRDTFRLRRAELKFTGQITPKVGWTIMIDPAKALSLNTTSATVSGTSVVTSSRLDQASRILQDAFLTLDYIPHAQVNFGQFKIPLSLEGVQSSAKLDTVERALFISDKARGGGFGDVRDVGVMVSGSASKYVDYQVGLFDGSGERQNDVALNDQKSTIGRLVLKPFPGFQFGGSGVFGNGGSRLDRLRRDRLGAEVLYVRGPATFKAEWMEGKDGDILRQGYYVHIGYKIKNRFEPVFRFDAFDPNVHATNKNPANVLEQDYLAGLNYYFTDNHWKAQLNYVRKTFAKDVRPSRNLLLLNLQTSW